MASTTLMRASTTIAEIKMPTSDDNKKYEKKNWWAVSQGSGSKTKWWVAHE